MRKEKLSNANGQSLLHAKNANEIAEVLNAAYVPSESNCGNEESQIYFGPVVLGRDEALSQEIDIEFNI